MKYLKTFIYFLLIILILCSCSETDINISSNQEVVEYNSKTFKIENALNINISLDSGNVDIYSWTKSEIKFEITKKVRGVKNKEILMEKLKNFQILYNLKNNDIYYNSKYKGSMKNLIDKSIDLKIYIPQKILNINCKMDSGKIKVFDQINCNLSIETNKVDAEINMFNGKLYLKGEIGDFNLNNGELYPDSFIKVNRGNINIKAAIIKYGNYNFETGTGNISLSLPETSRICFENNGAMDNNEFISENSEIKVGLVTGIGKIIVNKY